MKWFFIIAVLLVIIYLLGPNPSTPKYSGSLPDVPVQAAALEKYVSDKERGHKVKPDNEARIIWQNDSLKQQTEYSIVYLHSLIKKYPNGNPQSLVLRLTILLNKADNECRCCPN